jgi:hypothetical protein
MDYRAGAASYTALRCVPRFFAYELIQHHKPALHSLNTAALESLGRGNDSWEKVDTFACYLAGQVWRERQISDKAIKLWAHSSEGTAR